MLHPVVEQDTLCRDIYRVYWRHLVKSFGTVGKETTEAESALLLYMAQHFASAGNMSKPFNGQLYKCHLYVNVALN